MRIVTNKRRTEFQCARILAVLKDSPMTGEQLAKAVFLAYGSVMNYVKLLRAEKKIYVCDYARSEGRAAAVFSLGGRRDVAFKRKSKKKGSRAEQRHKLILAALAVPMSANMLAATIGITNRQMVVHLRVLRDAGKVFICHWQRTAGNPAPFYLAGQGVDAEKPGPKPRRYYTLQAANKRGRALLHVLSTPIKPVPASVKHRKWTDEPIQIIRRAA